jgi:hypothetical protein
MKLIAIVLGIICLAAAVAYFMVPAGSLPEFIPGYQAGSSRIHVTHAALALVAAFVLFGVAWFSGRSSRSAV